MSSRFLSKTIVIKILFYCSFVTSMSFEEIHKNIALWHQKKIYIQEISFDETLLDGTEIVDADFAKSKKIEYAHIRIISKLLFDSTSNYLQQKFSKIIEHTETNDLASHMNWNQNYFSVFYDLRTLKKVNNTLLDFELPLQHVHLCDHVNLYDIDPFLKCSILVNKYPAKQLLVAFNIVRLSEKKTVLTLFSGEIKRERACIILNEEFYHMTISNNLKRIALQLTDGRILLISPIEIDAFCCFNNSYDVNFVFA